MSTQNSILRPRTVGTLFVKIPFVYLMVTLGFLFDFVIGLPFLVICEISNFFRRG